MSKSVNMLGIRIQTHEVMSHASILDIGCIYTCISTSVNDPASASLCKICRNFI